VYKSLDILNLVRSRRMRIGDFLTCRGVGGEMTMNTNLKRPLGEQ
jgi:hypothetical protein